MGTELANLGTVFTIGHGGRDFDEFADLLSRFEITFLVDVRSAPCSRYQPEFSKEPLGDLLKKRGVRYVYMGDTLGGRPSDESCYVDGKVDYILCRQKEWFQRGIRRLRDASQQQLRIALMCSEGKPENCHRSKLIGAELDALGIPVIHIDERGNAMEQLAILERLTKGQTSFLENELAIQSRKRYG